jgi:hypothetical protein
MTPWMDAINKLRSLGYSVALRDERIRYVFYGKDSPSPDQVVPLIEVLKVHKDEIVNDPYFLIDQTLREINEAWAPGALTWVRQRPKDFEKIVALEGEINRFALEANMQELSEVLRTYKELMLGVAEAFKDPKGKTGNLFQRG